MLDQTLTQLQLRERGEDFDSENLKLLVTREGPALVAAALPGAQNVKGSVQQGTPADVPWISAFAAGESASAQQGVYLVYLFAKDGSQVFLSLNQGTERLASPEQALKKRVLDIQALAGPLPSFDAVGSAARSGDI